MVNINLKKTGKKINNNVKLQIINKYGNYMNFNTKKKLQKKYGSRLNKLKKTKNVSIKKTNKLSNKIIKNTYFTHDNGGRPFMVVIKGKGIEIYKLPKTYNYNIVPSIRDYTKLIKSYKNVNKIFIGGKKWSNISNNNFELGNTILVNLKNNKYLFIGNSIYEFETKDIIKEYYSPIYGSDISYPIGVSSKYVYFIGIDNIYFPKKNFKDFPKKYSWSENAYSKLYNNNLVKKGKKILKIIIIHKRIS
jgi:hypothetical protein